jgi:polyhydroxybutyrate depolymerase
MSAFYGFSGCTTGPPYRYEANPEAPSIDVQALLQKADSLAADATGPAGVQNAIDVYRAAATMAPQCYEAHVSLSHLLLLYGDGYASGRRAKKRLFTEAMQHAEAAMYANPEYRVRILNGEPAWQACRALGTDYADAMFFWINSVFYLFKETQSPIEQALNFRWIGRARNMMEHLTAVVPPPDARIDFLWGAYYLSIPVAVGGDRKLAKEFFDSAVENAPNQLLPRWGRAKYFHVKMQNPLAFRQDLKWILSQATNETDDHPAWRAFFLKDAYRMLVDARPPFRHRTGRYSRHARIHFPELPPPNGAFPLVLVLHGAFSTGAAMDQMGNWTPLANREEFAVVFPEGIGIWGFLQHFNAGHCCGKAARDHWDDVAFLDALIDYLCEHLPVDARRIYLAGFSNGGMMVHRYAAERSERLAAAAVVSGAIGSRASTKAPAWKLPAPANPIPMLVIHGSDDIPIPYNGGSPSDGRSERAYASVADSIRFWKHANNVTGYPMHREKYEGAVQEDSFFDADGRCTVRLCRIEDWGHQWPGGSVADNLPAEHPLRNFDAASYIWDFFLTVTP